MFCGEQEGTQPISRARKAVFITVMLANEMAANAGEILGEKKSLSRAATARKINLLGIAFDNVTLTETLERIEEMILSRQPHYIATANVDFVVRAQRDPKFRRALLAAHLVLCDGTPLIWASRILKKSLPERVAGSDLIPQLLELAAKKNYRLFFLGTTSEINQQAAENVRKQFPGIIVENYSPPFCAFNEMNNEEIARRIRAAQPDILLVAFGSPKAEKWMETHFRSLGVPVMIGVGATLDFLAGHVKRAPRWMQHGGLEWIFRLWQEPRRLFKRYMSDFWHFGILFVSGFLKAKSSSFPSSNSIYEEDKEQEKDREP